ncbi:hypothetical protein NB311A_07653 [Nitrobacter sp. Nb-311A]|uniref:DUF1674 domain-containing protein n=1 Tax=unclassified Nitrobacter TaxID=2620411 RepID=UPI0000684B89|nr:MULTISPECIES: DUF1674 domain-containing protein [unclassified Nitrobacter]EAQ37007.1 hypothetical protein NB311A_07653 [Nitrobacter sp. Nb-311A]MCB1393751.1 DUF1674 domain-containing protein [Nitrobacter sp.]MCV0387435.1 DUF1674 domain-containing protein [Nitrobacter sp.]
MTDEPSVLPPAGETRDARRRLPPAAERALAEAEARRAARTDASARPKEILGPKGPEPTRFGDWERNGVASDF